MRLSSNLFFVIDDDGKVDQFEGRVTYQISKLQPYIDDTFVRIHDFINHSQTYQKILNERNTTCHQIENGEPKDKVEEFVKNIKDNYRNIFCAIFIGSIAYALCLILMVIGALHFKNPVFVYPFLGMHLTLIIILMKNSIFMNLTLSILELYQDDQNIYKYFYIVWSIFHTCCLFFLLYYVIRSRYSMTSDSDGCCTPFIFGPIWLVFTVSKDVIQREENDAGIIILFVFLTNIYIPLIFFFYYIYYDLCKRLEEESRTEHDGRE